ncbi:uncharacterized protein LOC107041356 [Diachasma alloeum]|uniref:uncharacterized protein LOC107041356 n=1 Tax=Diachasma alloeum TaxID=454923 RepID=UPI0007384176|nr:uncharacterized protein LOC107041356 [Diachasma alloeum]
MGKSASRSDALIIRPKDEVKYAEILTKVKKDVPPDEVLGCVDKIRRTATGDMLIVLTKDTSLLGEDAEVLSKGPQENIEIKDLDDMTTKEEILKALCKTAGNEVQMTQDAIKSLRKAYGGTQTALVTLSVLVAKKILGDHGKIRIGWVNCRVKRVERPVKCFKCWHYGHLATKYTSTVDRSKLCVKCSATGHKALDCTEQPQCALCTEKGYTENCAHIAGSSRCPVYKKALHTEGSQYGKMKLLQLNLNHYEVAHDLLMQTAHE